MARRLRGAYVSRMARARCPAPQDRPARMTLDIPFDNTYARLPEQLFVRLEPTPVAAPRLLALNRPLARELGIDPDALASAEGVAVLAGNRVPKGAEPLAQAYAGHQFGGWVPSLGDGRAVLLGEVVDQAGRRRDIQLKGSGPTPFSRQGDGRAWLGPVLREYLVSEAMHALGIPTTRALAAVATGETVYREAPLPGAVLTRVAASHIRVGTFQYFAARGDLVALRALLRHAIDRHDPDADDAAAFLAGVVRRQARLVAAWMGVGFVHGVMNTDNTSISGETIDYGPCAFIDRFHPMRVFSSIDHMGRYAYGAQPQIAAWNLAQLATCLVPLTDADREAAIERLTEVMHGFAPAFAEAYLATFRAKLGLAASEPEDARLVEDLLARMAAGGADFTLTFRALSALDRAPGPADAALRAAFAEPAVLDEWLALWRARLDREGRDDAARKAAMRQANPAFIPRNHRVEEAIGAALEGDLGPFERLLAVLSRPFDDQPEAADLARPPAPHEEVTRTFCGT